MYKIWLNTNSVSSKYFLFISIYIEIYILNPRAPSLNEQHPKLKKRRLTFSYANVNIICKRKRDFNTEILIFQL